MNLTIDVTGKDFDEGRRYSIGHCPVAIATVRAFGKATAGAMVGLRSIVLAHEGTIYDAVLSEEDQETLGRLITAWDYSGIRMPTTFCVSFEKRGE